MRFARIGIAIAVPFLVVDAERVPAGIAPGGTTSASVTTPSPAGEPAIRAALEAALSAYERGSIANARFWSAQATALLAEVDEAMPRPQAFPLGNATQLLEVLSVYSFVADGSHPDIDAQVEWLVNQLEAIRWLDEGTQKPDRLGEQAIDYAPFTNLVRRVGDVSIDRNPFTQQIRRLGAVAIDYDPFSLAPRRIGAVTVDYDPFSGELREIAGIRLH